MAQGKCERPQAYHNERVVSLRLHGIATLQAKGILTGEVSAANTKQGCFFYSLTVGPATCIRPPSFAIASPGTLHPPSSPRRSNNSASEDQTWGYLADLLFEDFCISFAIAQHWIEPASPATLHLPSRHAVL
ncbi:hypothetical protein ZWY2020_044957 [Hordeum vulgare]|nr:hypothetical protein ZWY2020_044957 [Hordeum vulgare]